MNVPIYHRNFKKKFKKLGLSQQRASEERIRLFVNNPTNPLLNNHALHGKYLGYRSFNITGDLRIIYKLLDSDTALFSDIGSHSELYAQ